ncbi:MAG: hypothetical protein QOE28_1690 [Solirubrobacteraceae bacterium]|nr:hypothetical protein [Solirubrobacteraceae bacterium]
MLRPVLVCLAILLVFVPAANAASTTQILRDCADDGVLQGSYTPSELRKARQHIPTDTDEYTDCRDVLARAAADAVAGGGSGGSGGGASGGRSYQQRSTDALNNLNTPDSQAAINDAARKGKPQALSIGGRGVVPGTAGLAADAVRNGVPGPLVAVLILLGAAALAAITPFARRRVLARFKR